MTTTTTTHDELPPDVAVVTPETVANRRQLEAQPEPPQSPDGGPQQQEDIGSPAITRGGVSVDWLVAPSLIGNHLLAIGNARNGARIANVLAGESIAFTIYRENLDDPPEDRYEQVVAILPPRNDGRSWPTALPSGVPTITANEYEVADGRFMIFAAMSGLLPDTERHLLVVTGITPDHTPFAVAPQEIGRYLHRRLPAFSLWQLLMRWLRKLLRLLARILSRILMPAGAALALAVLVLAVVGAIVLIDPAWMGLTYIDEAKRFFDWLPWR